MFIFTNFNENPQCYFRFSIKICGKGNTNIPITQGFILFFARLGTNLGLRIRVHARKEVVYTEISHQNAEEGEEYVGVIDLRIVEHWEHAAVGWNGIDHKSDESPGFLRVPSPVVAPRHICPDGTNEDATAEQAFMSFFSMTVLFW